MEEEQLEKWVDELPEVLKAMTLGQVRLVGQVVRNERKKRRQEKMVGRMNLERVEEMELCLAARRKELTPDADN